MIDKLREFAEVEEHATLKHLNTYRIGGTAKMLFFFIYFRHCLTIKDSN